MGVRTAWTEVLAAGAAGGSCLALAWSGGGTDVLVQTVVYAGIFTALAVRSAAQCWTGRGARIPWGLLGLLGWPLLQLAPWPRPVLAVVAPERLVELTAFARQGVSSAANLSLYRWATFRGFLTLAAAAALFLLVRGTARIRPRTLAGVAAALLAGVAAEAALGIGQYLRAQSGVGSGWGTVDMQARGTFGNRNLLAAWLNGGTGLALGLAAAGWRRWWGFAAAGVAILAGLGVVATFSRLGLAGLALLLLTLALMLRRGWIAAMVGILLLAGAVSATGAGVLQRYQPQTLALERQGRLAIWSDAWKAARRYLWTGAGVGAFPYAFRRTKPYLVEYSIDHAHSDLLEAAVEWGLPATLLFVAAGAAALGVLVRRLRRAPEGWREAGAGCLAGAMAILLHGLGDFPLHVPAILALWCVLVGLAALCAGAGRGERECHGAGRAAAAAATAAAAALLAVGGGRTDSGLAAWNAEAHYRRARELSGQGRGAEAERAARQGLAQNPYASPLWGELALLAEERGQGAEALQLAATALDTEPYSRRALWTAANLRLRLGDAAGALDLFAEVAARAPLWRVAVIDVWGRAGLPAKALVERVAAQAPEALEDCLRLALARRQWETVAETAAAGLEKGVLSPAALRDACAGLLAAGHGRAVEELRRLAGGPSALAR